MIALREKGRQLLESGVVNVAIGYAEGSSSARRRPVFIRRPEDADQLVFDDRCRQVLAVYLLKPEVLALGKPAIVARPATLRAILQLAMENQLRDGAVLALAVADESTVLELSTFGAIEEHLARQSRVSAGDGCDELSVIGDLSLNDRAAFWRKEFDRCIKCYACRAACPLCYCSRCITDCNKPQWVSVASDPFGNLEWNVVRAMHLAGRCVGCGSCADACPQNIRIDLLNRLLAREASAQFGAEPGYSLRREYALAAFKPDDKEEFIR